MNGIEVQLRERPTLHGDVTLMGNVNNYDSASASAADRAQQRELLTVLGAWDRALRRAECGAWAIIGSRGTIHTFGDGQTWLVFLACRSPMHWTYTKRRLAFCTLSQERH
jgi:hypothetical protein